VSPEKKRPDSDAEAEATEAAVGKEAAEVEKPKAARPRAAKAKDEAAAEDGAVDETVPKGRRSRTSRSKPAAAADEPEAGAGEPETGAGEPEPETAVAAAAGDEAAPEAVEPAPEEVPEPVETAEDVQEPAGPAAEEAPLAEPERPKVTRAKAAKAKAKKPHVRYRAVEKPAPGRAAIIDSEGNEVDTVELTGRLFGVAAAVDVLHLAVRAEQAARRRGTASTRTRGEVSGSTGKLYRQKGTGRARAGSAKSPTRTGGGTAFGPRPRGYDIKVNRKVRHKALAMALSDRASGGDIYIAREIALEAPSTNRINEFLVGLDIAVPVLVVTDDEPVVARSVRNLRYAEPAEARTLSVEQVLRARSLVLTEKAFAALNEAGS
jgi:large subunit ribosomal protein L4